MKQMLAMLLLVAAMLSCNSAGKQSAENETKPAGLMMKEPTEAEQREIKADVMARVAEIYSLVEAAYRSTADMGPDVDIDREFCTRSWCDLRDKVLEKQRRTEYLCLDMDYWVMGQDVDRFYADSFEFVGFDEADKGRVIVSLKVHNMDSETPVELELVRSDGEWRIDNFKDLKYDIDFRVMMEDYMEEDLDANSERQ